MMQEERGREELVGEIEKYSARQNTMTCLLAKRPAAQLAQVYLWGGFLPIKPFQYWFTAHVVAAVSALP